LPSLKLALKAAWPTGWIKVPFSANGVNVTFVNPRVDIQADEVGILESVGSGADTINAAFQPRTPRMELLQYISGFRKAAFAAVSNADPTLAMPAYEQYYLDPTAENRFMFGLEGYARAGGLHETAREIKFFMYGAQPTANAQWAFRAPRGADALLQPNVELRALPQALETTQLTGTGIQATDPLLRSDLFPINRVAA
jgi:hypothetical protein